jgi:hypothetical protein
MATKKPTDPASQTLQPPSDKEHGALRVWVTDAATDRAVTHATIRLFTLDDNSTPQDWSVREDIAPYEAHTDHRGYATFNGLPPAGYIAVYEHYPQLAPQFVSIAGGSVGWLSFDVQLKPAPAFRFETSEGIPTDSPTGQVQGRVVANVYFQGLNQKSPGLALTAPQGWIEGEGGALSQKIARAGLHSVEFPIRLASHNWDSELFSLRALAQPLGPDAHLRAHGEYDAEDRPPSPISGNVTVSMSRTETEPTGDLALWTLIRNSTEAMSFANYQNFIESLFCGDVTDLEGLEAERLPKEQRRFKELNRRRALPFTDSESYRVLKVATEAFVMVNCGVRTRPLAFDPAEDNGWLDRRDLPSGADLQTVLQGYLEKVGNIRTLPYLAIIRRKLPDVRITVPRGQEHEADLCFGIIQEKLTNPCMLELLWSYWHEEGMLVQSMNAITQRFQNVRSPGITDALANSEIDILRPLNNLIWGYTQDEQHRLTVVRRNYEYDHHYGVRLDGKALQHFRPADSRSKFLEAFHHLLRLCTAFYKQDDDTTVKADAFPVLNGLKEVHLILSQGAHNQFGDLPSTARIEMLMQQWLLARPEFREFLPTRLMVAYPEPWMDRVDAMKRIQNWTDTSVVHFRNLAVFGEQILLAIRYGAWSDVYEPTPAFNWARFWRPQVQGYVHAYRSATGVDLSADIIDTAVEATIPSVLLRQRLAEQLRSSA